jgi:dipeptidase
MRYYRETYEGTEYDMTRNLLVQPQQQRGQEAAGDQVGMVKSPMVNNWTVSGEMANLLNTLKPGTVEPQRAIAIARCSYSQIIQNRGWLPPEIGTVAWFSFDNPGQSPRMPIFAGTLSLPNSFAVCGQHSYREDSAVWWFRRTNRLAMIKWGEVRDIIENASMEFEDRAFAELPSIENIALEYYNNGQYDQFRSYITKYSNDFAHATMTKWWELGNDLWTRYARGF